jgi:hypothetical protein
MGNRSIKLALLRMQIYNLIFIENKVDLAVGGSAFFSLGVTFFIRNPLELKKHICYRNPC